MSLGRPFAEAVAATGTWKMFGLAPPEAEPPEAGNEKPGDEEIEDDEALS